MSKKQGITGALLMLGASALLLRMASVGHGAAAAPPGGAQTVAYDAGYARWLNAPRTVELSQGVTFQQDDAFLKTSAATVVLDDQQRALNAKSDAAVHLYDTQNDLTGSQGFIDFTRHLATVTGNIVLTVKPGKREAQASAKSVRSRFTEPATLTCAQMTYDYRRKIGRVPGPLTVRQNDRVLTADTGEYDTRAQIITLTGNVHGHNGEGTIVAPLVKVGLQEGSEYISIPGPHVTGKFNVKPEPDDAGTNTPPAPVPPAPTHSPTPARPTASPSPASHP